MMKSTMEPRAFYWNQPNVVIQPQEELNQQFRKGTYTLHWGRVSQRFGIFRCEPLKPNIGLSKSHVMNILRAAYRDTTFRSFADAREFCFHVGIDLYYYEETMKSMNLSK